MKRTDRLTILIAVLLFLAFLAYMGSYVVRALNNSLVTAEALGVDFDLSANASGIILREETVLTSGERYVDVNYAEGERVAAGSVLATAVSSDQGLERANRIHTLELEISRVSAALEGLNSADSLTSREAALTEASRDLASAVARHQLGALDSAALNLNSLLLGVNNDLVSQERLEALRRELQSLRSSSTSDTVTIVAESSGTYSSVVDGYEHLRVEDVQDITPSGLEELIRSGKETQAGAYGKLVSGHRWYFVAEMDAADASHLTLNRSAKLHFGRYYSGLVNAKVQSISSVEKGKVAVLFRCDTAMADTLSMRTVSASVIYGSYSGIRVPAQAVQVDEARETAYVWCVTAMQLERKDIEIIYAAEDFVIVERGSEAKSLREGNTIVVSGKNLEEGKLVE